MRHNHRLMTQRAEGQLFLQTFAHCRETKCERGPYFFLSSRVQLGVTSVDFEKWVLFSVTVTTANGDKLSLDSVYPLALAPLTCSSLASQGFQKTLEVECAQLPSPPSSLVCAFYQAAPSHTRQDKDKQMLSLKNIHFKSRYMTMIHSPMVNMLKMVPTTAMSSMVPSWSKKSLLGIK